jgi:hypothetical protein
MKKAVRQEGVGTNPQARSNEAGMVEDGAEEGAVETIVHPQG